MSSVAKTVHELDLHHVMNDFRRYVASIEKHRWILLHFKLQVSTCGPLELPPMKSKTVAIIQRQTGGDCSTKRSVLRELQLFSSHSKWQVVSHLIRLGNVSENSVHHAN